MLCSYCYEELILTVGHIDAGGGQCYKKTDCSNRDLSTMLQCLPRAARSSGNLSQIAEA